MNKERFHNALAMALGYEQILKNKRYNITVKDNADEPKVVIKNADGCVLLSFNASEAGNIKQNGLDMGNKVTHDKNINAIVDAVHQAYTESVKDNFINFTM